MIGDAILVLRSAAGLTQAELAGRLGITQAALSRYESGLRTPDDDAIEALAGALGVTPQLIKHDYRMEGFLAAEAHMRRRSTARVTDWKGAEARLNRHRMHARYLLDRFPITPENPVLQADPIEDSPEEAARALRSAWRMPIGPVRGLVRWMEAAGILVIEDDQPTKKIDGLSLWAGVVAVVLINADMPTDRKRITLAHELGHLVLHSEISPADAEDQANAFAAEFLMPETVIAPQLRNHTLPALTALKLEWGVSIQALFERAYRLGRASTEERTTFYKMLSARGLRTREPLSDELAPEVPELAAHIGRQLETAGLARWEIETLVGISPGRPTPFLPAADRHLHAV